MIVDYHARSYPCVVDQEHKYRCIFRTSFFYESSLTSRQGREMAARYWFINNNQPRLQHNFENGIYGDGWLLGDSGYGLKSWLMTPMSRPVTNQDRKYNVAHRKTRCLVERAFGTLKSRWRIIDHTGGRLCYLPGKVSKITVTCCVLHNICKRANVPLLNDRPEARREIFQEQTTPSPPPTRSGLEQQRRVVSTFI